MTASGCGDSEVRLIASPPRLPQDAAPSEPVTLRAHPAARCAECHGKIAAEWSKSAHARARSSQVYAAMRAQAGDASCDRCHAPLAGQRGVSKIAVGEGVTCEVCHNIKEVEVSRDGAGFELLLDGRTKYGPLCDAEDHYFHKMGCSPLHTEGTMCAACHLYYHPTAGEALPVFTEFEEWRDGPLGQVGLPCQGCHMPGAPAEVATGAGERPSVSHHGMLGKAGDLRRRAAEVRARIWRAGGQLVIDAVVRNTGAGHSIPSGLPGRRLVLRAMAGGATAEHSFGRVMVDAAGKTAPFYRAVRVASDNRVPPRGEMAARLELASPAGGELTLQLLWRPLDPDIGHALEIEDQPELLLLEGSIPISEANSDRVTLTLEP